MAILYSDSEPRTGGFASYHNLNAVKNYLTHYENLMYLTFISEKSDDFRERRQADHELNICRKKLIWWKLHPNWAQTEALRGVEEIKKRWAKI